MFRYNRKICVMGLWGECFMNSKDFVDIDDAIRWFRHLRRNFFGERQRIKELWRF